MGCGRAAGAAIRCAALAVTLAACGRGAPQPLLAGRPGTVLFYRPAGPLRGFVFLFSATAGWTPAVGTAATALAGRGAAVVGVDLGQYLRNLAASDDGFHYVIAELEETSQRLQRELAAPRYHSPVLAGIGAGGTLAYAALAQAPAATVLGAVSIDPVAALPTRVPLCAGAPATADPAGGFRYGPVRSLPGWWKVVAAEPIPDGLAVLIAGGAGERLPPPPTDTPAEVLVATLGPLLAAPEVAGTAPTAGLPLTEIPAAVPGRMLAIIYSGDGGWRDIDKQIGGVLAENGVAVVGVDSLRYFWHEKPPDVIARDLAGIIDDYGRRWNRDEVILVGYSFGAGVLPAAINRLPAAVRDAVVEVSLLGLGAQTTFQIQVAAWFGAAPRRVTAAVLPEVVRLDLTRVQCVYGMDEDDTLCRRPELAGAEVVRTAGGHHFDGDYQALARRILDGARRRVRR